MSFQTQIRLYVEQWILKNLLICFHAITIKEYKCSSFQKEWKGTMKVVQMTVFQVFWSHTLALCEEQIKM